MVVWCRSRVLLLTMRIHVKRMLVQRLFTFSMVLFLVVRHNYCNDSQRRSNQQSEGKQRMGLEMSLLAQLRGCMDRAQAAAAANNKNLLIPSPFLARSRPDGETSSPTTRKIASRGRAWSLSRERTCLAFQLAMSPVEQSERARQTNSAAIPVPWDVDHSSIHFKRA